MANLLISHVDVAHGYFAYVNKTSFAYAEHLVHKGVTGGDHKIAIFPNRGDHKIKYLLSVLINKRKE